MNTKKTPNKKKFSITGRFQSFGHAFRGLKVLWREEHNSRIHFFAAILVIGLALYYDLKDYEYLAVIGAIAAVIICEVFNTAIEQLCNLISPEYHVGIKKIKDLSAAAVLLSSLFALIVGSMIFIPRILG